MNLNFLDHIVLIVKDIKTTTEFYSKFLGEPIQRDTEQVAWQIGETKLFFGLPYKEYQQHDKDIYGLNHLAFGVRSSVELKKFETFLNRGDIKHSGIQIDKFGNQEFIWFDDPDGYRIEFYNRPKAKFYRIVVGNRGIYEAVDRDCPKGDPRRDNKPDGSWLPKKGVDYPGAVSFWSDYGLKKYRESGLMDWHRSVVNGEVEIITINRPNKILHEDEYQIIVEPKVVIEISKQSLEEFIRNWQ